MTVMLVCGLKQEKKNLYTLNRENGVLTMGSTSERTVGYLLAPIVCKVTVHIYCYVRISIWITSIT